MGISPKAILITLSLVFISNIYPTYKGHFPINNHYLSVIPEINLKLPSVCTVVKCPSLNSSFLHFKNNFPRDSCTNSIVHNCYAHSFQRFLNQKINKLPASFIHSKNIELKNNISFRFFNGPKHLGISFMTIYKKIDLIF